LHRFQKKSKKGHRHHKEGHRLIRQRLAEAERSTEKGAAERANNVATPEQEKPIRVEKKKNQWGKCFCRPLGLPHSRARTLEGTELTAPQNLCLIRKRGLKQSSREESWQALGHSSNSLFHLDAQPAPGPFPSNVSWNFSPPSAKKSESTVKPAQQERRNHGDVP